MEIKGTWKIDGMLDFLNGGYRKLDPASEDESEAMFAKAVIIINDTEMLTCLPITEDMSSEQTEQAKEEGMAIVDGCLVQSSEPIKFEDGKWFYNTGIQGDIMGEEINPWTEFEFDGEYLCTGMLRFRRA